jgi:hypothetical protein
MGSLAQQSVELKAEQTTMGELADVELPTEVYSSPTTVAS